MSGKKKINSDVEIQGKVIVYTVPNGTGTVITYNPTTKEFSTRTNAELISDMNLMTTNTAQDVIGYKSFFSYLGGDVANNRLWVRSSDGSNPAISFVKDGADNGQVAYNGAGFLFFNTNSSGYVPIVANGFVKNGSDDSYLLTGGGGHIPISNFAGNHYKNYSDTRIIRPDYLSTESFQFGFTSWNNNNTYPYADYIHFGGYQDSSGGLQNLIVFKKNGFGIRQYQGNWQDSSPYSNYVDYWNTENLPNPASQSQLNDYYKINNGFAGNDASLVPNGNQVTSIGNSGNDFDGDLSNKTLEGTFASFNGANNVNKTLGFSLFAPTSTNQGIYYKTWYNSSTPWRRLIDSQDIQNYATHTWANDNLVTLTTDQNNITGRKSFATGFSSYTGDGLFSSDAKPLTTITPSGNSILLGYKDYGGGQYYPRIGFKNNGLTNWSLGALGNDFVIGINNEPETFKIRPSGATSKVQNSTQIFNRVYQGYYDVGANTGILAIKMPQAHPDNAMFSIDINIYGYESQYLGKINVAFYKYVSGLIIGNGAKALFEVTDNFPTQTARVGIGTDGYVSILLGDSDTFWDGYFSFEVAKVEVKYSNIYQDWSQGWTHALETDLSQYSGSNKLILLPTDVLATRSWVNNNLPTYSFLAQNYALRAGSNATDTWVNAASAVTNNPYIPGKIRNSSGDTDLMNATYGSIMGMVNTSGIANGNPNDQWFHRIKMLHANGAGYYTELGVQITGGNSVWFRRYENGSFGSGVNNGWIQLWDNENLPDYRLYGLGTINPVSASDLNNVSHTSILDVNDSTINKPLSYGSVWTHRKGTVEYTQFAVDVLNGNSYTRGFSNAYGSTGWKKNWNDSDFTYSDINSWSNKVNRSGDNMTGTLSLVNGANIRINGEDSNWVQSYRETTGNVGIVAGFEYAHYATRWKVGNRRGGSTDSLGFAFEYSSDNGASYTSTVVIGTDSNIFTQQFGAASQWYQAYLWGNHATAGYLTSASLAGYATESWVSTYYIPKTHPVYNITQANINSWNTASSLAHSHSNLFYLNNIDQFLGVGQAPRFNTVMLMDSLGYGTLMFGEDNIGGESGLADVSNDVLFAARINEYIKYGSRTGSFEAINVHFDSKNVCINRELGNDEDKVQLAGNISVDTKDLFDVDSQLILNPLYNTDGFVRDSRNAHIYVVSYNDVTLPQKPILGQRIEIFNGSDSVFNVIHDNVGVLFTLPGFFKITGIAGARGFIFDENPVPAKMYDI